jgi:hypothetical protein
LEAEWSEDLAGETERPDRQAKVFIRDKDLSKSHRSGVRASIVAMKIRNGIGAKGRRLMDAERAE